MSGAGMKLDVLTFVTWADGIMFDVSIAFGESQEPIPPDHL